jgi:hypothetical protein
VNADFMLTKKWIGELTKIISEKIGAIDGIKKICPAIILEKLKE